MRQFYPMLSIALLSGFLFKKINFFVLLPIFIMLISDIMIEIMQSFHGYIHHLF